MAVSIEELDSLVREFYEGRGEQVRRSVPEGVPPFVRLQETDGRLLPRYSKK